MMMRGIVRRREIESGTVKAMMTVLMMETVMQG
jgi:hypothetical protein